MLVEWFLIKAPLDPTARCDQLPTLDQSRRKKTKIEPIYSVSAGKVKQASKKKGDSLFDCVANGGFVANKIRPMDDPHQSDCFVSITGIGDNLVPQKIIGHCCAISRPTTGDCLFIYAKYACVPEHPTSMHLVIQLKHYKFTVSDRHWLSG